MSVEKERGVHHQPNIYTFLIFWFKIRFTKLSAHLFSLVFSVAFRYLRETFEARLDQLFVIIIIVIIIVDDI